MKSALLVVAAALAALPAPALVARVPTGAGPCDAAAAFGALWVAVDSGALVRIDPRTSRVVRRVGVGRGACSVAAGAGALWVGNYRDATVRRVDPRTGAVRRIRVGAAPFDVVVAFGRVWVTCWEAGELDEIDPRSLSIVRRVVVGPRPAGLLALGGALWIGFGRDATAIARLDPASGTLERVPVGVRAPNWLAAAAGDLWVTADGGNIVRVDPVTGAVRARLEVGRTLAHAGASGDGTVWVPDKEQGVVHRVDPATNAVIDSFPAGPGAFTALRAFRSMWVASYAGDDVWRFATP